MKPTCIDDQSPDKSWEHAIALEEKRKEVNKRIIDMNERIKAAWRLGTCPHQIALNEGISVHYVRQIGPRWKA